ncbi:hypothetical protein THRCLA_10545 [Thraustotheca clavata]|uniref:Uncharacterized protein n=1 Tax=Thraustotheca clavata TaxID=74557 RepID=A0A1V9YL83_9STRA|nr:hypothetical protein THRCLA_10545 [Thraustotheca clavata]
MVVNETVRQYLSQSGIDNELQKFLSTLFANREVPGNPYPKMLDHFRQLEQIEVIIPPQCNATSILNIDGNDVKIASTINGNVFAQKHIAERIDQSAICSILNSLEATRTCPIYKQSKIDELTTTIFITAVGLNVFTGQIVKTTIDKLNLEQGDKLEKIISVFTSILIKDLYEQSSVVYSSKIQVTTPSYRQNEPPSVTIWTLEMIQSSKNAFISNIKAGVIAKSSICLQFIMEISLESCPKFCNVDKHYNLHHITNSSVRSFCENPWISIDQGIFFHREAIQFYVKCIKPTLEFRNKLFLTRIVQAYESHDFINCFDLALHYSLIEPKSTFPLSEIMTLTSNSNLVCFRNVSSLFNTIQKMIQLQSIEYTKVYPQLQQITQVLVSQIECLCLQLNTSYMAQLRSFMQFYLKDIAIVPEPNFTTNARMKENTNFSYHLRDTLTRVLKFLVDNIARDIAYHLSNGSTSIIYQINQMRASLQPTPRPVGKSFFSKKKPTDTSIITNQIQNFFLPSPDYVIDILQETSDADAVGKYPRLITASVVQLQYLVDTRLDIAFTSVLSEILNDRILLPAKIYPTFVSRLRAFGARYIDCEVDTKKQINTTQFSDTEMLSIEIYESEKPSGYYGTRLALAFAQGNLENLTISAYFNENLLQSNTIAMPFTEHIIIESLQRNTFRQCHFKLKVKKFKGKSQ